MFKQNQDDSGDNNSPKNDDDSKDDELETAKKSVSKQKSIMM